MYNKQVYLSPFLFPAKNRREEEKVERSSNLVFNQFCFVYGHKEIIQINIVELNNRSIKI